MSGTGEQVAIYRWLTANAESAAEARLPEERPAAQAQPRGERARDTDGLIRLATAVVVTAVAAVAAVVSFSHIYALARLHGQSGTAARLLPLSVDGLILAASLVLLHEARNNRDAPGLARSMLWLGIGATVAANVAYGLPYGDAGAVISAWPAVSFVGAVEMMMLMVRRARSVAAAVTPASAAVPDIAATPPPPVAAPKATPAVTSRAARTAPKKTTGSVAPRQKARDIRDAEPDITSAELARRVGVSVRTLQRWQDDSETAVLSHVNGSSPDEMVAEATGERGK